MEDLNYTLKSITKTNSTNFKKGISRVEKNYGEITKAVKEAIDDVSIRALERLKTNRKSNPSKGMWTIADKNSQGSIKKWRRERLDRGNTVGFIVRNNATASHNGYRYPDLILNKEHSAETAGLTNQVWSEFWEEIDDKLKKAVRKAIKDNTK